MCILQESIYVVPIPSTGRLLRTLGAHKQKKNIDSLRSVSILMRKEMGNNAVSAT